jgi:hypothetical protein
LLRSLWHRLMVFHANLTVAVALQFRPFDGGCNPVIVRGRATPFFRGRRQITEHNRLAIADLSGAVPCQHGRCRRTRPRLFSFGRYGIFSPIQPSPARFGALPRLRPSGRRMGGGRGTQGPNPTADAIVLFAPDLYAGTNRVAGFPVSQKAPSEACPTCINELALHPVDMKVAADSHWDADLVCSWADSRPTAVGERPAKAARWETAHCELIGLRREGDLMIKRSVRSCRSTRI